MTEMSKNVPESSYENWIRNLTFLTDLINLIKLTSQKTVKVNTIAQVKWAYYSWMSGISRILREFQFISVRNDESSLTKNDSQCSPVNMDTL